MGSWGCPSCSCRFGRRFVGRWCRRLGFFGGPGREELVYGRGEERRSGGEERETNAFVAAVASHGDGVGRFPNRDGEGVFQC